MPRFVILQHDHPVLHWDFMLEAGGMLRTWRLTAPPVAGQTALASGSFDHRLMYLDYEGPVSGNRGNVRRWDHGEYEIVSESEHRLEVELRGATLRGRVILKF